MSDVDEPRTKMRQSENPDFFSELENINTTSPGEVLEVGAERIAAGFEAGDDLHITGKTRVDIYHDETRVAFSSAGRFRRLRSIL